MSGSTRARPDAATAVAAAFVATVSLAGCAVGQAGTFDGRAEDACAKAASTVAALPLRTTGTAALAYVLDRYATVERLVAEIAADSSFPGGPRGRLLRARWIDPARASLRSGRTAMGTLRTAVNAADAAASSAAFSRAAQAGTTGVDVTAVAAAGLPRCAAAFTPSPTPSATPPR